MRTYVSVGIGDMVCLDSLLTEEEKNNITEMYWACRFGSKVAPLLIDNPSYPNLKNNYFIEDEVGVQTMRMLDPVAVNFWHFRPDFHPNFEIALSLFGIDSNDLNVIDMAAIFSDPNRKYQGSSFFKKAVRHGNENYILFHYPTSTRPRSDIATITNSDWNFVEQLSAKTKFKVIVISDHELEIPLSNYELMINPDIRVIVSLVKYCSYYAGCDSFCSILAVKRLPPNRLFIKSHKYNIQQDILTNVWQQKYFLPHSPKNVARFYKNYIGE